MAPTKKKKEGVVGETLVSLQREGSSKGTVGSLEKIEFIIITNKIYNNNILILFITNEIL
jgi:hypothetical protein